MIKRKKKECKGCGNISYIYSKSLCLFCYNKTKKPIKKISDNHRKTLEEYKPKRLAFLKNKPYCQLRLEGCTKHATCIHHKKGKHSKALYLDENYWLASCISCNNKVETIGKKAYEMGLKIKHNVVE